MTGLLVLAALPLMLLAGLLLDVATLDDSPDEDTPPQTSDRTEGEEPLI